MLAARLGFWVSAIVTGAGLVYCVGLLGLVTRTGGGPPMRPSETVQLWVGLSTFGLAQLILVIVACIHSLTPEPKRVLSHLGLLFTVLFAAMVSINRFVQLTIIRQAAASGRTEGLERFLPYSSGSIMFSLEILGWGFFLGVAALVMAPIFARGRLGASIRWSLLTYGALSLTGTLGYALDSNLFLVGFVAWGFVLYVAAGLLAVWFRASEHRPD